MRVAIAILAPLVLFAIGTTAAAQNAEPGPAQDTAVERFVHLEHEHGVPFREAHSFGSSALPKLLIPA
jgi:hypothetical protein